MPSKRCTVDNLVLWDGPFGIVVSGTHNDLRETYVNHVQTSSAHLAFSLRAAIADCHKATGQLMTVLEVSDFEFSAFETPNCNRCRLSLNTNVKDLVQWFKYDQIGAACIPSEVF